MARVALLQGSSLGLRWVAMFEFISINSASKSPIVLNF